MSNEEQNGNNANAVSGGIRVRMMDYMVHFKTNAHTLQFECYPVEDWNHMPTGKKGFSYIDKGSEPDYREVFEEGECVKKFEGLFCWRGVWEGRLYFTDEEYWGEEISEMSDLYNNHIVPWCKEFIKKRNPSSCYDE